MWRYLKPASPRIPMVRLGFVGMSSRSQDRLRPSIGRIDSIWAHCRKKRESRDRQGTMIEAGSVGNNYNDGE
jgi:hypothetical protein